MNWFSRGYHDKQYYSWVRTHDGDEVTEGGGHTLANRDISLIET